MRLSATSKSRLAFMSNLKPLCRLEKKLDHRYIIDHHGQIRSSTKSLCYFVPIDEPKEVGDEVWSAVPEIHCKHDNEVSLLSIHPHLHIEMVTSKVSPILDAILLDKVEDCMT